METREMNEQATGRRARRTLEKPETYDPASYNYPERSVKPVQLDRREVDIPYRELWHIVVIGAVIGVIGGIILIALNEQRHLLYEVGSGGGVAAHCLIWGALLGALLGLCLSPLYLKLRYIAPVLAALLFLPTILYLLTPVLVAINTIVIEVVKFLIALAILVIGFLVVKAFFCD